MSIPNYHGHRDPREGEWPEESEWCFDHGQRKDSCGRCRQQEIDDELIALTGEGPYRNGATVLGEALCQMLARIQERDDETKGTALAARFEGRQ